MEDLNQMKSVPGEFGKGLITKVDAIVNRNPDLKVLYQLYEDNPSQEHSDTSIYYHILLSRL